MLTGLLGSGWLSTFPEVIFFFFLLSLTVTLGRVSCGYSQLHKTRHPLSPPVSAVTVGVDSF